MVFSSMIFLWVFFPTVFVLYKLLGLIPCGNKTLSDNTHLPLHIQAQNVLLLVASLLFYAWGEPRYVVIMLLTIVINYYAGRIIGYYRVSDNVKTQAPLILALTIVIDLGILGYFKYYETAILLLRSITGLNLASAVSIALPVGISFYTFQAISYVVDVYRGDTPAQRNLFLLALYISFFPQLVAGPIVKYTDIRQQLSSRTSNASQTAYGVKRFLYGLAKKVLIANYMAATVDVIFALPISDLSTPLAWAGAFLYTMQIYYDFSGYSDMAIGLGRMFGFMFPENFNLPYTSRSIREFWRRWHISLSTWFRQYVYIPLGGNRKGNMRTYINLMIVFLVTGVWHGAGLSFIMWGVYHGVFMLVERAGFGKVLDKPQNRMWSHLYTLFVVLIGWVLFRADRLVLALSYLRVMFVPQNPGIYSFFELVDAKTVMLFVVGILLCGVIQAVVADRRATEACDLFVADTTDQTEFSSLKEATTFAILLLLLVCCTSNLISGSYNPFIYFRF